jgi:nitroimidazol reductase NimA-like FMN-containing flavoprotein (pyridoxamine 5'-phosphate oxidase superfamily)
MADRFVDTDLEALRALVAAAPVAHVAFVDDAQPFVLPVAVAVTADGLLLHGSTGSRWLTLIGKGIPVSIGITTVAGLVVARSAFESSMHYRSAVLFGRCEPVTGDEKIAALDLLTDTLIPGRVAEIRRPTAKELAATLVLRCAVDEWSLKISDGWPEDPEEDVEADSWAGVLPARTHYRDPLPAPDLRPDIDLPPSVRNLLRS